MQSILVYGRLLTRAVVSGVCNCSSTSSSSSAEVKTNNAAVANLRKRTAEYRDLRLLTAQCGFPKDFNNGLAASVFRNKAQFGDDACFSAKYKTADVIGVADGVGGWRSYGVDPSLFSFSLMQTCERLVSTGRFNPRAPAGIIAASYYELLENKEQIIGSSTACVLVLNRLDQKMYTANIGDSGFLVLREGHIVHRSEEQQHYFNTPFQLSVPPPEVSGQVLSDSPESAVTSSFNVQEGDLILLATDGLFDNLTDSMIVRELSGLQDHRTENIQKVVNSLAYQAWRLGFDSNYLSPFAQRAREYGIDAIGGKPDDITVLLASVGLGDQCSQFETTFAQSNCTDYG